MVLHTLFHRLCSIAPSFVGIVISNLQPYLLNRKLVTEVRNYWQKNNDLITGSAGNFVFKKTLIFFFFMKKVSRPRRPLS